MKHKFVHLQILSLLLLFSFTGNSQNRREIGNLILEEIPEIPEEIKAGVQQYQNTRSASFVDWLPDNKGILMSTRFGNTEQLHTLYGPGMARNQITFFDEPVYNARYCPSPEHNGFIYLKDFGGNEFSQHFWYDTNTGKSEMISDGESVNFNVLWSNSGDQFAFASTRRNKKNFDIYVSSISSPKKADSKIIVEEGYWIPADWSPDDKKLVVFQYLSSTEVNSFILDVDSKELTQVNDNEEDMVFIVRAWDSTGKKIYATTNQGKDFRTLVLYDVQKDKFDYITDDIPWDVEQFIMNKSRTRAAFTVNENGYSQLYLLDTKTNRYNKIPGLPIGQISNVKFHPTQNVLAIDISTTQSPGDIFTLNLDSFEKTQWTFSEVGGLETSDFPEPELITYETFDEINGKRREIPAFVYKPRNAKGPLPVLISIHGGPEGQHVPYFSSFYAYLTNELNIAVIAPNVRGSSGYGTSYLKLDNGFNRENSVKDIGKLIEWIGNNSEFDNDKIAVYGGSYGGYMVLSSMFNFNNQIKCGIDIVGISNFVTFLENTEAYRRDARRAEYGDERDPEMKKFLHRISPTTNVDKINQPLFVIQGANDPRVPASESEQMVKAIRENNGVVWYMLAKDEGHGFRKKENRDKMTEAVIMFLKEHLITE